MTRVSSLSARKLKHIQVCLEYPVQFSSKTAELRNGLAIGTPIPLDHPLMIAFETGLPLQENSYVPFRKGNKRAAFVDAHPEGNVVYAILTLTDTN